MIVRTKLLFAALLMGIALLGPSLAKSAVAEEREETAAITPAGKDPVGDRVVRLSEEDAIWVDLDRNLVLIDGEVCLRQGQLELFACLAQTKEHEAIVAVNTKAKLVHAALLAVGATEGSTVQFRPEYTPASGTEIQVLVLWVDEVGTRHSMPAQQWVRSMATKEALESTWVFAGSVLSKDPESGESIYGAEAGDLICVSNFPTATLDLPVESSELDSNLLFEAFTDHIPPVDTPVRLVLIPVFEDEIPEDEGAPAEEDATSD